MSLVRLSFILVGIGCVTAVLSLIGILAEAPAHPPSFYFILQELHHWFSEDIFHLALVTLTAAGVARLARK